MPFVRILAHIVFGTKNMEPLLLINKELDLSQKLVSLSIQRLKSRDYKLNYA